MPQGSATVATVDGFGAYAFRGDNDTVAVAIGRLPQDRALAQVRHPAVFEAVAASVAPIAPWVHPDLVEPITGVAVMGGLRSTFRQVLCDGHPRLLGLYPVGDALATTNPAFGRGISLAFAHAEIVTDGLAVEPDSPVRQAELINTGLVEVTTPFWRDAVRHDRERTVVWRSTLGLPVPSRPAPTRVPLGVAALASQVDAEVWVRFNRVYNLFDRPGELFDSPEVAERIAGLTLPDLPPFGRRADIDYLLAAA
jgi:hypothetical protein